MFAEEPAPLAALHRWSTGSRIAALVLGTLLVIVVLAPVVAPYDPAQQLDIVGLKNAPPSFAHWFGTDRFSRDLLSRAIYGTRLTLAIATLAVVLAGIVGTAVGVVAGMAGGVIDTVLMRGVDAMLAIPRVLLLIAVLALWSPVPVWAIIVLLGITGWFGVSRLARAETMSLHEREFVLAARAAGASPMRIMLRHVLPNVLAPVVVATATNVGNLIVLEAGLSFIGVGVREPASSLGTMFQQGTEAFVGTWWAALFPGLIIVVTVLCLTVVGDALRQSLDPRQVVGSTLGTRGATSSPTDRRSTT